jgi:ferredoxin
MPVQASQIFELRVRREAEVSAGPGEVASVRAHDGETLLRALQRAHAPILSVCGGQASCGACRIEIDAAWFGRLAPAGKTEAMLLEYLEDPRPHHRLACQVAATPVLDGLRLTLAP